MALCLQCLIILFHLGFVNGLRDDLVQWFSVCAFQSPRILGKDLRKRKSQWRWCQVPLLVSARAIPGLSILHIRSYIKSCLGGKKQVLPLKETGRQKDREDKTKEGEEEKGKKKETEGRRGIEDKERRKG